MGNYDKYIVTTPRPEHLTHYRLPLDIRRSIAFMDSDVVDGACNMECVWYYKPFLTAGPSRPRRHRRDTRIFRNKPGRSRVAWRRN